MIPKGDVPKVKNDADVASSVSAVETRAEACLRARLRAK
jgi:hypothetical protein